MAVIQLPKEITMVDREAYKKKMAAQLEEWSDRLDALDARVMNSGTDIKLRRAEEMHALRVRRNHAWKKMKELDESPVEAWGHASRRTATVMENLKAGVNAAHARFTHSGFR